MPADKNYEVTARGVNEQGNRWDNRNYGPDQANDNAYHYSNKNGSYYYSNSDGSKYYNDGKGQSWYERESTDGDTGVSTSKDVPEDDGLKIEDDIHEDADNSPFTAEEAGQDESTQDVADAGTGEYNRSLDDEDTPAANDVDVDAEGDYDDNGVDNFDDGDGDY